MQDLNTFVFVPCWCTHEEEGAELSGQMWVTSYVVKMLAKCNKALWGANGLCAHLNLIVKNDEEDNFDLIMRSTIRWLKLPQDKKNELERARLDLINLKYWLDWFKRRCHWSSAVPDEIEPCYAVGLASRSILELLFKKIETISETLQTARDSWISRNIDTTKLQSDFDILLLEAQKIIWFELQELRNKVRIFSILCA